MTLAHPALEVMKSRLGPQSSLVGVAKFMPSDRSVSSCYCKFTLCLSEGKCRVTATIRNEDPSHPRTFDARPFSGAGTRAGCSDCSARAINAFRPIFDLIRSLNLNKLQVGLARPHFVFSYRSYRSQPGEGELFFSETRRVLKFEIPADANANIKLTGVFLPAVKTEQPSDESSLPQLRRQIYDVDEHSSSCSSSSCDSFTAAKPIDEVKREVTREKSRIVADMIRKFYKMFEENGKQLILANESGTGFLRIRSQQSREHDERHPPDRGQLSAADDSEGFQRFIAQGHFESHDIS